MKRLHDGGKFGGVDQRDSLFPAAFNDNRLQGVVGLLEDTSQVCTRFGVGYGFRHSSTGNWYFLKNKIRIRDHPMTAEKADRRFDDSSPPSSARGRVECSWWLQ